MSFLWCSVLLAVAIAVAGVSAQNYIDALEADLSSDTDQDDTGEVMLTGPVPGYGTRGCSTFCSCTGSLRSSYCCPSSRSTCGVVPIVQQPTEIYSGRTGCRGALCYRQGWRIVRPPTDDLCTSRLCDVLRPTYVRQQLGHSCTSHGECGDDVCCGHRCATVEACNALPLGVRYPMPSRSRGMYPSAQAPPTSLTGGARWCEADVNCNREGTRHHICCNGQCRTPRACNPRGSDLHELY